MDDRRWGRPEVLGIGLVLAALVLGLVAELIYFAVWTSDGSSMRILLAFIAVQPLQFVLERVGPAGAAVWVVGACLVETGRVDQTHVGGRRWNRERLAIMLAVGAVAAFLGIVGGLANLGTAPWFAVSAVTIGVASIAAGLYLLWTAKRLAGASMKIPGAAALAFALAAVALNLFALGQAFGLMEPAGRVNPTVTVASSLLGAGSLAIWILLYSLVLLRARAVTVAVPPAPKA